MNRTLFEEIKTVLNEERAAAKKKSDLDGRLCGVAAKCGVKVSDPHHAKMCLNQYLANAVCYGDVDLMPEERRAAQ